MIGGFRYMLAAHQSSPFFTDKGNRVTSGDLLPWEPEPECPQGWISNKTTVWTYMQPQIGVMRTHGWKIHITASPKNASAILEKVSKICISENVTFKYLRDKKQYHNANAKYAGRNYSGKFITIYPFSDEHLVRLVSKLEAAIGGETGPYILSDLRYKNGPIFFRYGAFIPMELFDAEGGRIAVIPGVDGILQEDVRGVKPIIPPGATTPEIIQEAYKAYNQATSTELDAYTDIKALHFSNAGGVYYAQNKDNEKVLLKEARPYAGLDDYDQDSTTRLHHEWAVLRCAEHLGITPKPLRQFKVWEHQFLEMEYIAGIPLNDWIVEHLPVERDSYQARQNYKSQAMRIAHLFIEAVEKLHTTGYAHGDLQPGNILVSRDGEIVRLIDLEGARALEDTKLPAMNALGYQPPKNCTAEQADWFAVSRLIGSFFEIQNNMTILSPQYWLVFLRRIQETFGEEPVNLIRSFDTRYPCENGAAVVPLTPEKTIKPYIWPLDQKEISLDDLKLISEQTSKGIKSTRHAVPGKLFPGDAKLESTYAQVNIATGASGVLLSLLRSGNTIDPVDVRWVIDSLVNVPSGNPDYGLFSGQAGIATFLYEAGENEWAKNLIRQISENWKVLRNFSLESGMAGIGLALTAFGLAERNHRYIETAEKIANHIQQELSDSEIAHKRKKLERSSNLFQGWSGIALFFSSLGKATGGKRYFAWAASCIKHDLVYTEVSSTGRRGVIEPEYNRSLPYLATGSAGILTAISWCRLMENDESLFSDVFESLAKACESPTYAFCGLYNGRAGIMCALAGAKKWIPDYAEIQTMHLSNLLDYGFSFHEHPIFAGDSLLRLSADYSTGSAGVLSTLTSISGSGWDFLPIADPIHFCGQKPTTKQSENMKGGMK